MFVSLVLGLLGMAFFIYGRKQGRLPQLALGILFIVYPWLGLGWLLNALIGVALVGLLLVVIRLGL
jgi:hypothetical protein